MRIIPFLASRGFAVALLILSVLLLILRVKEPDLYSPLFLLVPAFLLLSLTICTLRRLKTRRKDLRFIGSMLFHGGLMIWIITLFLAPFVRFYANLTLLQDVETDLSDKDSVTIVERPVYGELPVIWFKLKGYRATYKQGVYPVDYSALLEVSYMGPHGFERRVSEIRINQPLDVMGYRFLFASGGFVPLFRLKDEDGKVLFERYVLLSNDTAQDDSFSIKEAGLEVYTRFFPDVFFRDGRVGTRSRTLKNPAFGIKVAKEEDPFRDVYRGVLRLGEEARIGRFTLEFADLKPFVYLQMVRDPLYPLMILGWTVGAIGLVMRYGPLRRRA